MDLRERVRAFLQTDRAAELLVRLYEKEAEGRDDAGRRELLRDIFAATVRAPGAIKKGDEGKLAHGRIVSARAQRQVRALQEAAFGYRPGADVFHDHDGAIWFAVLRFPEPRNWNGPEMLEHLQKTLRLYLDAAEAATDRGFVTVLETVTTVVEIAKAIDGR